MKNIPVKYKIESLYRREGVLSTLTKKKDGEWIPARPLSYPGGIVYSIKKDYTWHGMF